MADTHSQTPTESQKTASEDAAPGNSPPANANRLFLRGLLVLSLSMGISIGFVRVATALFAVDLHAQGLSLGAVALAQSIGMLVLGVPAGQWVGRYGARRVFLIGTGWAVMAALLTSLAQNVWTLAALTASASLAMPLRFVAINSIFLSKLQVLGPRKAGWFRASHVVGMTFIGASVASALYPLLKARPLFWMAAAMFALNIAIYLRAFGAADIPPPTPSQNKRQHAGALLLTNGFARRVVIWEFLIQSLGAYYAFYIVVIVVKYHHFPAQTAGVAVATQGLVFVAGMMLLGGAIQKSARAAQFTGLALVLLALWALATFEHPSALYAAASTLGLGLGLLQTINLVQLNHLGQRVGFPQAAALNALAGPCGGVLGGALGGILEPYVAPQPLFLAFAPFFFVLALYRTKLSPD